eukprot:360623-Chlamydomonas_euryale.AAC.1
MAHVLHLAGWASRVSQKGSSQYVALHARVGRDAATHFPRILHTCSGVSSLNGGTPTTSSYRMHPSAHQSTSGPVMQQRKRCGSDNQPRKRKGGSYRMRPGAQQSASGPVMQQRKRSREG